MDQVSDIIIVGGGVIGTMSGWRLQKAGYRVIILDAASHDYSQEQFRPASLAAAGMLAPSFEASHTHEDKYKSQKLEKLGWHSLRLWHETAQKLMIESGISIDYREEGIVGVALCDRELETLKSEYQQLRSAGHQTKWLSAHELSLLEPGLSPDLYGGYHSLSEKQVDPLSLHSALWHAFTLAGGTFLRDQNVTSIIENNSKVKGVIANSNQHKFWAPIVILATGTLLQTLTLPFQVPHIYPVKGEALCVSQNQNSRMDKATNNSHSLRHVVRHKKAYLCPKSDGRMIIGATSLPNQDGPELDDRRINGLRSAAEAIMPDITSFQEQSRWAGLRPATGDGNPIIGKQINTPEGLLFAIGHYRNGILLAPATAEILCTLIENDG